MLQRTLDEQVRDPAKRPQITIAEDDPKLMRIKRRVSLKLKMRRSTLNQAKRKDLLPQDRSRNEILEQEYHEHFQEKVKQPDLRSQDEERMELEELINARANKRLQRTWTTVDDESDDHIVQKP